MSAIEIHMPESLEDLKKIADMQTGGLVLRFLGNQREYYGATIGSERKGDLALLYWDRIKGMSVVQFSPEETSITPERTLIK